MRTGSALGFSLILHLLLAMSLVAVHGDIFASPNVVIVDWIKSVPGEGQNAISSSPIQRPRKAVRAPRPEGQAKKDLAPAQEISASAANDFNPGAHSRQITLEESYLASVRQTLERHKVYPPLAKRLGQTGNVTLKFEVAKGGEVLSSELTHRSLYPVLNEAAKNLILGVRFPPIPEELGRPSWQFTYLVKYELN